MKTCKIVVIHPEFLLRFTEMCVLRETTIWYGIVATQKRLRCKQDLKSTKIDIMHTTNYIVVPYDTKFWREKTLANLANCKRLVQIFLYKIFSVEKLQIRSYAAYISVKRRGWHC